MRAQNRVDTTTLPATLGRVPGISYAVTGDTAGEYDFTRQLHDRTPVVLAVVAGLAFVLLLVAFRSVGISLGIGTAAAVLIDATVVRGILVPAALTLLGNRAWPARRA